MMAAQFCTARVLLCLRFTLTLFSLMHNILASVQQFEIRVIPQADYNQTECDVSGCFNLTNLIQQNNVMTSNMKILFQSGTHTVQQRGVLLVTNVTNFTLSAADLDTSATIQCNYLTGFRFLSVTNFEISGLTFDKCGWHHTFQLRPLT